MDHTDLIQKSLDYIEDNLMAELRAEELASLAGFSRFHFHRVFQASTGMPVMQYVLRRRLLHAIYAIRCGSSGIDAALRYGFDTYPGFYRAFRREFGCTPSAFLRSCHASKPYRIQLKKEEHIMVTHKKIGEMLKHWALSGAPIADIYREGARNDNACYVGDRYVLKYTSNLGKVSNHITLSRLITAQGLCAATVVETVDGREYVRDGELYFYLTNRLPGRQISAGALYDGDPAPDAHFVGEIIGRLHHALSQADAPVDDADLYRTVADWALPDCREHLGLSPEFCRSFTETFGQLYDKLPRQIIHRDPNPGNIICRDGQWGFIDFELSERNIRLYDPCYAATAVLSESFGRDNDRWLDICRDILRGYDSVVHLTQEERSAAPYLILANQLVCTAWFAGQEKYAELFRINVQMTRWLISQFDDLAAI